MVELKIGKKIYEMRLVSWDFGSALLPLKEDEPAAERSTAEKKIIAVRPDGRVLRAFDRRRLAWKNERAGTQQK